MTKEKKDNEKAREYEEDSARETIDRASGLERAAAAATYNWGDEGTESAEMYMQEAYHIRYQSWLWS